MAYGRDVFKVCLESTHFSPIASLMNPFCPIKIDAAREAWMDGRLWIAQFCLSRAIGIRGDLHGMLSNR